MRHLVHPLRRWLGAILLVAVPVVPSPRAAVGPLPASDAALATAVQARLARSARLFASRPPRVSATGGTVRLSGTVPDLATRRRAVRIAAGQRGVLEIETDLPVAGRNRTDRALRIQIDAQLATHADLRPPRVTTTVDGGRVIVQGQVNSVGRYLFVRDRLEHISGLSEIDLSNLTIESRQDGPIDDDDLRDAMVSLIRDPYRFPVSGRVDVEVQDHVFVLTGTVPRLLDRLEALDVAALVADRSRLRDEMTINPDLGRLRVHTGIPPAHRLQ